MNKTNSRQIIYFRIYLFEFFGINQKIQEEKMKKIKIPKELENGILEKFDSLEKERQEKARKEEAALLKKLNIPYGLVDDSGS